MNRAGAALLLGVAAVAVGVAAWAGPNLDIAAPAATVAVVAGGLLLVEDGAAVLRRSLRPLVAPAPAEPDRIRAAFRSGRLGRQYLVDVVDDYERTGPSPGLPRRDREEMDRIVRLSPTDFLAYLERRLDEIEDRS